MNPETLEKILTDISKGKLSPKKGLELLKTLPYEDLGFARLDHHRALRSGTPEVIYCEGKTKKQIGQILKRLLKAGNDILATRMSPEVFKSLKSGLPEKAVYNEAGRTLSFQKRKKKKVGLVVIVTAGTSDIPVAEEASATAELFGSRVEKVFDVGVAGIHRLFDKIDRLREARVVVVIAGMDGALASVVGGLVKNPVVAVPTSVGYGASFGGVSALLTMLNSCAPGLATVNIDNGFGAGCLAHKINLAGEPEETQ